MGCVLIYVVGSLAGSLLQLPALVRGAQSFLPHQKQVRPQELEAQLKQQNVFGLVAQAGSNLHCQPSTGRQWDFVCTFSPTPKTSTTRVQFGVTVTGDGSIFEISRLAPTSTNLPAPEKVLLVR